MGRIPIRSILLLTLAALLIMAFLFDAPLREQANPAFPENPAKSPWYFLGIQELVSYSAFAGGIIIPFLFLFFLFSIPYIDREDRHIGAWFSGPVGLRITSASPSTNARMVSRFWVTRVFGRRSVNCVAQIFSLTVRMPAGALMTGTDAGSRSSSQVFRR